MQAPDNWGAPHLSLPEPISLIFGNSLSGSGALHSLSLTPVSDTLISRNQLPV